MRLKVSQIICMVVSFFIPIISLNKITRFEQIFNQGHSRNFHILQVYHTVTMFKHRPLYFDLDFD